MLEVNSSKGSNSSTENILNKEWSQSMDAVITTTLSPAESLDRDVMTKLLDKIRRFRFAGIIFALLAALSFAFVSVSVKKVNKLSPMVVVIAQ